MIHRYRKKKKLSGHRIVKHLICLKFPSLISGTPVDNIIMNELYCKGALQYYPSYSEFKDIRSTIIANCVFNNFLTYTAIMLNIVTIYAIRKTSTLAKTLKTLLLSLAVSDVGVGLFVQPFYTSFLINWLRHNNPSCNSSQTINIAGYLFSLASFLGAVAVSVDRFLAVHLHLRYQELVTHKRVIAVVISVWVFSAFVSLITLWASLSTQSLIISIAGFIGILLTTVAYIKIYLVARRHKNQIQSLQAQVEQTSEMANFASLIKSAVGIFYVYLAFLVCYLPYWICVTAINSNRHSIALKIVYLFSTTLVFLNSSLNPVIYCWKMRHIRHAIMDILRNMSWNRNRVTP